MTISLIQFYFVGIIYNDCHKEALYAECHLVEGHYNKVIMLSVVMPNLQLQQAELFECYFNCYIICASFISNLPLAHRQKLKKKNVKSNIFQLRSSIPQGPFFQAWHQATSTSINHFKIRCYYFINESINHCIVLINGINLCVPFSSLNK
jgi:hypothetical protein